jgi:hypothetical protein
MGLMLVIVKDNDGDDDDFTGILRANSFAGAMTT